MTYSATVRLGGSIIYLTIHGALGPTDARRMACNETGAMPWQVTVEESRR